MCAQGVKRMRRMYSEHSATATEALLDFQNARRAAFENGSQTTDAGGAKSTAAPKSQAKKKTTKKSGVFSAVARAPTSHADMDMCSSPCLPACRYCTSHGA